MYSVQFSGRAPEQSRAQAIINRGIVIFNPIGITKMYLRELRRHTCNRRDDQMPTESAVTEGFTHGPKATKKGG